MRAVLVDEHGSHVSSVAGDEHPVTIARRSEMLSATVRGCIEWEDDRDDGPHKLVTDVHPPPPEPVQVF